MEKKLYKEELLEHFKNPNNYGKLENPDFTSEDGNPSCGDKIKIEGKVSNGVLTDVKFTGNGCVLSQASASMLTELCKNKSIDDILNLSKDDISKLLKIELGPVRIKCAILPLFVLQKGINMLKGDI